MSKPRTARRSALDAAFRAAPGRRGCQASLTSGARLYGRRPPLRPLRVCERITPRRGSRTGKRPPVRPRRLGPELDDRLEPAPEEAHAVERHRLHQALDARVAHDLRHDLVAVLARLVRRPREDHGLAGLELHALRERCDLALL